jgi:hypothetical protein
LLRSDYAVIGTTSGRCQKPRIGNRSTGIVCEGAEESLSGKVGVPGWVGRRRLGSGKVRDGGQVEQTLIDYNNSI